MYTHIDVCLRLGLLVEALACSVDHLLVESGCYGCVVCDSHSSLLLSWSSRASTGVAGAAFGRRVDLAMAAATAAAAAAFQVSVDAPGIQRIVLYRKLSTSSRLDVWPFVLLFHPLAIAVLIGHPVKVMIVVSC